MSGEFIKNLGCCEATIGRSPLFPYKRMFIRKKKPFVKNGFMTVVTRYAKFQRTEQSYQHIRINPNHFRLLIVLLLFS